MDEAKWFLETAKNINSDIVSLVGENSADISSQHNEAIYDLVISNKALRKKTEKLFKDGHYARAVEEAYKLLDNLVKKKSKLQQTDMTGVKLMQTVFSPNKPLLKLNEGSNSSEQNEQSGYMQILSGCMMGIRNPRAHESDWEDTEQRAIQLLVFANHLIERINMAEVTNKS